jgi:uncharacterized LabA/DUF88 family protein
VVEPTPKFKSQRFKNLLGDLKAVFDAHSLGTILMDALDQKTAGAIVQKTIRGQGGARAVGKSKSDLVGQLTSGFFENDQVAFQVIQKMDKACAKERSVVASIPEEQAPDRVGSYRAIALEGERGKFVWAVARDERESVRTLANRVINDFFEEAAGFETAKALSEAADVDPAQAELARRLTEQTERLAEAQNKITQLEHKVLRYEEERARLMAQVGGKERRLRQEAVGRAEMERTIAKLQEALQQRDERDKEAERASREEQRAQQTAEELAQKVRRLEKLAGASERLQELQNALSELEKTRKRERQQHLQERARLEAARADVSEELQQVRADLARTREELHQARSQLAERPARGSERTGPEDRVAVLLDQANLAAVAHLSHGRKVNFEGLLRELWAGRKPGKAVAFVVDNGGKRFEAFCDTLRRAGWDLRIKRPKSFSDGSQKADWDMALAVEAIDQAESHQTVVIVSGDGDFEALVRWLRRRGTEVEVAAFPNGLAAELEAVADRVHRLGTEVLE